MILDSLWRLRQNLCKSTGCMHPSSKWPGRMLQVFQFNKFRCPSYISYGCKTKVWHSKSHLSCRLRKSLESMGVDGLTDRTLMRVIRRITLISNNAIENLTRRYWGCLIIYDSCVRIDIRVLAKAIRNPRRRAGCFNWVTLQKVPHLELQFTNAFR